MHMQVSMLYMHTFSVPLRFQSFLGEEDGKVMIVRALHSEKLYPASYTGPRGERQAPPFYAKMSEGKVVLLC